MPHGIALEKNLYNTLRLVRKNTFFAFTSSLLTQWSGCMSYRQHHCHDVCARYNQHPTAFYAIQDSVNKK